MKKLSFLFVITITSLVSSAQSKNYIPELPVKDGAIFYEEIVSLGTTAKKEVLYFRARKWFANYYKKATQVLQMDDKDQGKLIGKGGYSYSFISGLLAYHIDLKYTLNLTVKDGKYRYQIYDFHSTDTVNSVFASSGDKPYVYDQDLSTEYLNDGKSSSKKYLSKLFTQFALEINTTISSLKAAMIGKANSDF